MSSQKESQNCPISVPVPITVTVNTSATDVIPLSGIHPLSASNGGFTRISEFTFAPTLTTIGTGMVESIQQALGGNLSISTATWDFGDGHTLNGSDAFIATHTYAVPGIYTVSVFFYDNDGGSYINTLTESVSVYNYAPTRINIDPSLTMKRGLVDSGNDEIPISINAGQKPVQGVDPLGLGITASWQDVPDPNDPQTVFFTVSGSKAKPYDTNNKYAHLVPFNALYDDNLNIINNTDGVKYYLNPHYFFVSDDNQVAPITAITQTNKFLLYSSTYPAPYGDEWRTELDSDWTAINDAIPYYHYTITRPESRKSIYYYDDIPNYNAPDQGVNLIIRLDTSKHKLKNFYVDNITTDINTPGKNYLETNYAGTLNLSGTGAAGIPILVYDNPPTQLTFTSTGMKEMSAIQYKRQGDKFQIFVSLSDDEKNILKNHPIFKWTDTQADISTEGTDDYTFYANWTSAGGNTQTSNISSVSTSKFPYNTTTEKTELSSFLYVNIDPLSAGTWTLNVSAKINALATLPTDYGNVGQGNVGYGCIGSGLGEYGDNILNNSYTFTICPSTNDVEIYKVNEDIDYSQTIKNYRFQSFLHEYDNLFDGVFTSFVGSASSSPTTFGKTIFEKTANFVSNNSDIDFCKIENIQAFYDFFNEDIDIITPTPPPELKRLYDLFSIKISKLLGDYERVNDSFDTNFYTNSADSRNIDFTSPITTSTYTVSAYTNFVARQKFNNEFILIKPQKIASISFQPSNELWDITTKNLDFQDTSSPASGRGWEATVSDQINNTGNTPLSGWVYTGSVAGHNPYTGTPSVNPLHQNINAKPGTDYKITVTVASSTTGTLKVIVGQDSNAATLPETAGVTDNGTHTVTITNKPLGAIDSLLRFEASQDWNGSIDNIIIQELISAQYPLSAYNEYSNWGWSLDTSVSGSSGLDMFYEFYPYTAYDTTLAENIQNSIIDYTNPYTTISRSTSSLSGSWENDGGIIFKNLDYQIRKGLKL